MEVMNTFPLTLQVIALKEQVFTMTMAAITTLTRGRIQNTLTLKIGGVAAVAVHQLKKKLQKKRPLYLTL